MISLPNEIRNDPDKRAKWLNRNRPTTNYFLFINKKTGEYCLTNGIFFEMMDRHPNIKKVDGKYLIEPANYLPYSFREDGTHVGSSRSSNPRIAKCLNEIYSTAKLDDNPVIYIYKFKDVE